MTGGRIILPPTNPSLDSNGNPVSGSTLTYYQNGTTTPVSIYAEAALSTPLANPLTSDSAGVFPQVYAADTATYSVKWTRTGYSDVTYNDIHTDHYTVAQTQTRLNSGTNQTYTTPVGCRQLKIRMVGGGGGGGGSGTGDGGNGTAGGDTTFASTTYTAKGGGGATGNANAGGSAGTGGSGTGLSLPGSSGASSQASTSTSASVGGVGGSSVLGGGSGVPSGVAPGYGGGGHGGNINTVASGFGGAGGGAGEYREILISPPSASYTYTVGAGGGGGTAGTSGNAGSAGLGGIIIIDEVY